MEDIRDTFLKRAEELWDTHEADFMSVLAESESKVMALTFRADMDFSESTAKLRTTIRFSEVHTDHKDDDFDDPTAPRLPGIDPKAEEKPKRSHKKKPATEVADEFKGEKKE